MRSPVIRTILLPALAAAALATGALPRLASAKDAACVSTFKVNPARTSYLAEGPQPPLALRWTFRSRETKSQIEGYPSIDDGFSPASIERGVVYVGGHDGHLYAIDARTGRKLWEYRTGDHVVTTPQVKDGVLYTGSMDGYFRALRAADGALLWQTAFGTRTWNGLRYGGMRATPIFYDGKIFLGG